MNLYLNDKERSMQFLRLLEEMLNGAMTSLNINLDKESLISDTKGIIDPVEDFLEYYIQDASLEDEFDECRLAYVKNALYAAKGAPEVFHVFELAFDVNIEYDYPFPLLKVITFQVLRTADIILFVNKFKTLLFNLLYYTELTLKLRELVINLIGNLNQTSQLGVKGFRSVEVELDENGF